jgi:hypothetical protein
MTLTVIVPVVVPFVSNLWLHLIYLMSEDSRSSYLVMREKVQF